MSIQNKYSETKPCHLCLASILKDFTVEEMKKTELAGYAYDFSVEYNTIDVSDIVHIYKQLMKKIWYKIIFKIV